MTVFFRLFFYLSRILPGFGRLLRFLYACDISKNAQIGKNVIFAHNGLGVVVSQYAKLGDDCFVQHHVCLGINSTNRGPVIGNHCTINAYAMILGDVRIGNNVIIGAGSIVMKDIPDNSIYYNRRSDVIKDL